LWNWTTINFSRRVQKNKLLFFLCDLCVFAEALAKAPDSSGILFLENKIQRGWQPLKKKPPFPTKGTAAYKSKTKMLHAYSIFVGVPYARTLNKFMIPARFSDLRSKRTLPVHL
jgi:hypothetical protein